MTVQVRSKGVVTLPAALRHKYGLGEGDVFTLVDLGDGSFLLTPRVSQLAVLGGQVAQQSGLRVGTPGDALAWVRSRLREQE